MNDDSLRHNQRLSIRKRNAIKEKSFDEIFKGLAGHLLFNLSEYGYGGKSLIDVERAYFIDYKDGIIRFKIDGRTNFQTIILQLPKEEKSEDG